MPGDDARLDFRDLRLGARIPVLWGDSRAPVKRVLFGLARAVSASPYWVEIRGRQQEPEEPGPADLGWIEPGRLFYLGDLFGAPSGKAPPPVDFPVISFLRDPTGASVAEAMRLATAASPSDRQAGSGPPQGVIAVANVDRVDPLWPESPRAMQAVVRAFLRVGLVPYFSTQRATRRSEAADFVFRAVAADLIAWKTGKLVCEKAPEGAFWRAGDSLPLTALPSIAGALSGKVEH